MVINATLAIDNVDFGFGLGVGVGLGTGLGLTGLRCKYVCKNPMAAGI